MTVRHHRAKLKIPVFYNQGLAHQRYFLAKICEAAVILTPLFQPVLCSHQTQLLLASKQKLPSTILNAIKFQLSFSLGETHLGSAIEKIVNRFLEESKAVMPCS